MKKHNKRQSKIRMRNGDTVLFNGPGKLPTILCRGYNDAEAFNKAQNIKRRRKILSRGLDFLLATCSFTLAYGSFQLIRSTVEHSGGTPAAITAAMFFGIMGIALVVEGTKGIREGF